MIYANLFCQDWKEGSPIKSPYFETIKRYSEKLLKAQINIFKPDIIVFASGINAAPHRREFFPVAGDNKVCKNGKDYAEPEKIPKHQLWEFELYDGIRCFRIHHPCARAEKAQQAREFLITLLPAASEKVSSSMFAPQMESIS